MPVEIRLLNHGLGMLQLQSGIVLESEEREYRRRFCEDYTVFDKIRFNIIDSTCVEKTLISNQYAVESAKYCEDLSKRKPDNIVAIICHDDVSFGMARMWISYADSLGWTTNAFREVEAAYDWTKKAYQEVYGEPLDEIFESSVAIPVIDHSNNPSG